MILNLFDPVLLIDTEPNIKIKFKKMLSELKKFKVQAILVLEYKKGRTKLTASDSDTDEAFKSMH